MNEYLNSLQHLQWRKTWHTLQRRFTQDQLSLVASSLTFTTTIALVPLLTLALAIFTAHPFFADLQKILQKWLIDSLVPEAIAKQVMGYIVQFTSKAHKLGWAGLLVLLGSVLALVYTIDTTLNRIWGHHVPVNDPSAGRVRHVPRSLWKRTLVYTLLIAFGPLLLSASLALTTAAAMWTQTVVGMSPVRYFLTGLEFIMVWAGLACVYRFVPHVPVMNRHAIFGALIAAAALELAKKGLTLYLVKMPTYSMIYGAFAIVPVLLIWIYLAWLMVLLGAEIAASLADLRS